ncbi:MAG: hypothetical protein ACTSU5_01855 [Promethearchaeota archaeon]
MAALVSLGVVCQFAVVSVVSSGALDLHHLQSSLSAEEHLDGEARASFIARRQYLLETLLRGTQFNDTCGLVANADGDCCDMTVREAGYYALAYLEVGDPTLHNVTRANRLINNIIDVYLFRDKYGGFRRWGAFKRAYFDEAGESYDHDTNWVNFVSPFLLYFALEHDGDLFRETRENLRRVLPLVGSELFALQNRVTYTNIYLLRCAGEVMYARYFNDVTYASVAKRDFTRWREFVTEWGFPEYNSPNYCYVSAWALSCIHAYAVDGEVREWARALLEWFFVDYASHYHPAREGMAGVAGRMSGDDRKYGLGSHANFFFLYFGIPDFSYLGSSGTRIFTAGEWCPPEYFGEIALDKTYPLVTRAFSYGINRYTYMERNYSLSTQSGARYPSLAGSTGVGLSGQAEQLLVTYNASYPTGPSETGHPRNSCWFDTSVHYNVFNSVQDGGYWGTTAVTTVNFDVQESRKSDQYWLGGYLGSVGGISEVWVNGVPWNGEPVALNHEDCVTLRVNQTFIGFRPTPSRVEAVLPSSGQGAYEGDGDGDELIDAAASAGVNSQRPVCLAWVGDELRLTSYAYLDPGNQRLPGGAIYVGLCVEASSLDQAGSFGAFTAACNASHVGDVFDGVSTRHRVTYESVLAGKTLEVVEYLNNNSAIERKVGERTELSDPDAPLFQNKYAYLPRGASLGDFSNLFNTSTMEAEFGLGEGSFPEYSVAQAYSIDASTTWCVVVLVLAWTGVSCAAAFVWRRQYRVLAGSGGERAAISALLVVVAVSCFLDLLTPVRSKDSLAWYATTGGARAFSLAAVLFLAARGLSREGQGESGGKGFLARGGLLALYEGLAFVEVGVGVAIVAVASTSKLVFAFHYLSYVELIVSGLVLFSASCTRVRSLSSKCPARPSSVVALESPPGKNWFVLKAAFVFILALGVVGSLGLGTFSVLELTRSDVPQFLSFASLVAVATSTAGWAVSLVPELARERQVPRGPAD